MVSNNYASMVGALILARIVIHVQQHNLGYVTGADGSYRVSGERYIPDVGFVSRDKQPEPSHEAYNPLPPDLAVEVLSPTNQPTEMRIKVVNYLAAHTQVWVVDSDARAVEVYRPGQPVQRLDSDGTLDGGDVLPGFTLAVGAVFPES